LGISIQAHHTDRRKVLVIAHPADPYLDLALEQSGMDCSRAEPAESLRVLYGERPDLVIIDCSDPEGMDASWRSTRSMSSARCRSWPWSPAAMVLVTCLQLGADAVGYTPIRGDEIKARLDRLLARVESRQGAAVLADGFVRVDRIDHSVACGGHEITLTPTEFRMLVSFVERPDQVLGHSELIDLIWRDAFRGKDEVKLYVSYLRRKFRVADVDPIETVRGVGYSYRPASLVPSSARA
jgi:DNA-binding response OmpR family regulator